MRKQFPEGQMGFWLAQNAPLKPGVFLHVVDREENALDLLQVMNFCAPQVRTIHLPAWDCLPYDRLSPSKEILIKRVQALEALKWSCQKGISVLVLLTPQALMQKVSSSFGKGGKEETSLTLSRGSKVFRDDLLGQLHKWGFERQEVVREWGEFALRGSLVDIFPGGEIAPLRLDFFGDLLEQIKTFDPLSQRTTGGRETLTLSRLSECVLTPDALERFKRGYRLAFPSLNCLHDPLFQALSQGRTYPGMEHWLPLFEVSMVPLWDLFSLEKISFEREVPGLSANFGAQIQECYKTRQSFFHQKNATVGTYAPLPPQTLYVESSVLEEKLSRFGQQKPMDTLSCPQEPPEKGRVLLSAWTLGGLERLKKYADDKGRSYQTVASLEEFLKLPDRVWGVGVLSVHRGFESPLLTLLTEEDLFGKPLRPSPSKKPRADQMMKELAIFEPEDYVVHQDHGIARYGGLEGVAVGGMVHDCLLLIYAGEDKLYVPVENMNLVSRYGSKDFSASLDRLGLSQWQARKARVKKRLTVVAEYLIKLAAARAMQRGPTFEPAGTPDFEDFCRQFPYVETDDQLKAIQETLEDLEGDHPMDRLICGDVGFGKTEVALRAAFMAARSGYQVALIAPTTLLARQHFQTFQKRFAKTPYRVVQLSRLVSGRDASQILEDLGSGQAHIVIATHALLRKNLTFHNLGLLIVDEEQHFGVAQKEKLKKLKANLHVLTLSATPIPRTLQMALSGLREMSLITTPPLSRLAVQTFLLPFDGVVIREAILREYHRGGQIFYVCPRLEHLEKLSAQIKEFVPEVSFAIAHGQMPSVQLEKVMGDFERGAFDVLLSTNIVESGIDIATANTLIIHRADLFGLAQLYQLRGRVGRGKVQGYAYFTTPEKGGISQTAQRRLEVIRSLDYLGAGFAVASHDADIRGGGNLVGEEQSGHMREVGVELYQQMLQETVEALRQNPKGGGGGEGEGGEVFSMGWTPTIHFPASLRFPETYIADLNLRLGLYRRLSDFKEASDIEAFEAELIDRFGPLPEDVKNLLQIMTLKILSQKAFIEKLEIGEKGAVLTFYQNHFPNPQGLLIFLSQTTVPCRLSPDHKLRLLQNTTSSEGLETLKKFLEDLGKRAFEEK